jgi:hypothetical protein
VSDFYQIQLRRFKTDIGASYGARPLTAKEKESKTAEERLKITGETFTEANDFVVFDVSPTVSESRSVDYVDQALPGPVGIVVYKMTGNRRFSISSRFVSRTGVEAKLNYDNTNLLRSWQIPHSADGKTGRPPILRLNGYKKQFYNIPVVLADMTINYPEDVDYIEVADEAMVPIIQTVELTLIESHKSTATRIDVESAEGVSEISFRSEFDLAAFKSGNLPGY